MQDIRKEETPCGSAGAQCPPAAIQVRGVLIDPLETQKLQPSSTGEGPSESSYFVSISARVGETGVGPFTTAIGWRVPS